MGKPPCYQPRRAPLGPFMEKEGEAWEASVPVTCSEAEPALSLSLGDSQAHVVPFPGLMKPGHRDRGAKLPLRAAQTPVRRSWYLAPSHKAPTAAMQILSPTGKEVLAGSELLD